MTRIESEALVVRTVEVGEADVVTTLLTERSGKVAAVARGSRKGSRRLGGALEPVHTVGVLLEDRGGELATLKEARIVRLRSALVSDLEALDCAGIALRWARHLFPARTPEPGGWAVLIELLETLDAKRRAPRHALARAGLAMLVAMGYGIELEGCVVCGRPCPEGRAACLDPVRGGIVCRACGGAPTVLGASARQAARALVAPSGDVSGADPARSSLAAVTDADAEAVLRIVDRAMAVHTDFER